MLAGDKQLLCLWSGVRMEMNLKLMVVVPVAEVT